MTGPSLLRFMTCGSVDDGKSTLIGRLMLDAGLVHEDLIERARKHGQELHPADLLDGLKAEKEQGITIDVAYRYFSTPRRSFIVADTPGHEQYTRNMATGASTSDLALLVMDVRAGLKPQTRRHAALAHLFGINHVVMVVNKMDAVGYDEATFRSIEKGALSFARKCGLTSCICIPVSALLGENVCTQSDHLSWYDGPTVLEYLETACPTQDETNGALRLPIQWVCRPNASFRGYAGTIEAGHLYNGQTIHILPGNLKAKVTEILKQDEALTQAGFGETVMVTLDRELDIARGHVLVDEHAQPAVSDQIQVNLVWMHDTPLRAGSAYIFRSSTQKTTATFGTLQHKIDIDSMAEVEAKTLENNQLGQGVLNLATPIVIEPFPKNRPMGSFILCDPLTQSTVAAGTIRTALSCGANVHWQNMCINASARAKLKGQRPFCLWLTGLSGAGKSTLATRLEKALFYQGLHTYILDGDNVRHGLNRDLGFTDADRVENIRRVAETARLMVDAGLIVIVSFISPFRTERAMARSLFPPNAFYEVFVDAPLTVCEERDPKGLYKKARQGLIHNFTGLSSPYEQPENPDLHLDTATMNPVELTDLMLKVIRESWLFQE